jgi:hypothetical protein
MITLSSARLLSVIAVLSATVMALHPTPAVATMGLAVDPRDGFNAPVLPALRLGTMDRLYLRGADLAIVNSGACALLAHAERRECLEKLSGDIASPLLYRAMPPRPE